MQINHNKLNDFKSYLKASGMSDNTILAYSRDLSFYFLFCKRFNKLPESGEGIFHYFSYLSGNKKLESSSIERKRAALVSFYDYQKKLGNTLPWDFEYLKAPKKKSSIPNFYSSEKIKRLLNSFDLSDSLEHRNFILILILFGTGMRLSELSSLTPKDIDLNSGKIKVLGKGNKERQVYLPLKSLKAFHVYINRFSALIKKHGTLFFNRLNEPLSARGIQWILSSLEKKHPELQVHLHPHAFRHSFATGLLENGADIRKVAEIMGHSSLNTTQKYTHISKKKLMESYQIFHPHAI